MSTRSFTSILRPVTALGWSVLAFGGVAWAGAWWSGWEELAVVVAICAVAMGMAVLFTLGRSDYDVSLEVLPRRVTVGDRAGGSMVIRNVSGRRSLPVSVELPVGRAATTFRIPSLAHQADHDELFSVPTHRRAVIPIGPATTVRGDPLGLLRRERELTEHIDLFVHPRISTLERLGAGFLRDLEGQTTNDLSPSDVAFHTLREYVPGDDRRHIHWKTTARMGTLMVRQFVDTRRSFLSLVLSTDEREYADVDEFELAISMAASLGVRALRDEQTVTLVAGDRRLPTVSPVRLLDSLSGVELAAEHGGVHEAVVAANEAGRDASIVALATGSVPPLADLRAAANRLSIDARVIVLRADLAGTAGHQTVGETTVLNTPDLDEFGRLLLTAGSR